LNEASNHLSMDRNENVELNEKKQKIQRLKSLTKKKDYYKVIGIKRDATSAEIKSAFRKLALKLHPDRIKDKKESEIAEKKLSELNQAYDILYDPEKRRKYDDGIDPDNPNSFGGGGSPFNFHTGGGSNRFTFNFGGFGF